jgi:chromosome segregation ATPase
MIRDMVLQLMDEANEEASQRGWCTTELGTNKQTRDDKTDGVTKLTSQKDKLTADIAKLGEEIADLTKAIAEIDRAVAQATLTRNEEKSTNAETIADATEAQTAVSQALTVLKEFYQKAATATALVQAQDDDKSFDDALLQEEPKKNPFAESSYTGMGSENTGVVGMLEVIASDFARLESETEMAEEQSSKEFERFSDMSAEDKAVKNLEMQHRSDLQVDKKKALNETEKDLKAMQTQLDSALAYYDKLKPACIYTGEKYEDRVARRQAEIEGLEDALKFFEGQDLPPML